MQKAETGERYFCECGGASASQMDVLTIPVGSPSVEMVSLVVAAHSLERVVALGRDPPLSTSPPHLSIPAISHLGVSTPPVPCTR